MDATEEGMHSYAYNLKLQKQSSCDLPIYRAGLSHLAVELYNAESAGEKTKRNVEFQHVKDWDQIHFNKR